MHAPDGITVVVSSCRLESRLHPSTSRIHCCPRGPDHADAREEALCPQPKG